MKRAAGGLWTSDTAGPAMMWISDGVEHHDNITINFTIDTTNPVVNATLNKSITNITANDVINLTANITDNLGLSFCQVIINQSGPDNIHIINISLGGVTTAQCSNSSLMNLTRGNVINYTIRANDTSNNWRTNDTIITVENRSNTMVMYRHTSFIFV